MKTLNTYVTKQFCTTLGLSIGILTFALMGANMIKVFKLLANGVLFTDAALFMLNIIPSVLVLGIPWGVLVSIMLVFGKLSADNEITAMRACGVSILQIISPIIVIVFGLSMFCLWLQLDVAPVSKGRAKQIGSDVMTTNPSAMFQPGEELPVQNMRITVGERDAKDNLIDVQIYVMSDDGSKLEQDIRSQLGKLKVDEQKETIYLTLYEVTFVSYDESASRPIRGFYEEWTHPIRYGEEMNREMLKKRDNYMAVKELLGRATLDNKIGIDTTPLEVELHQRLALGLSPIAFLLLGLPLAVRTSRRETSMGLLLSVGLAGLFLTMIMIFRSMEAMPQYHPQLLLWLPNVLYQFGGTFFIYKIAKR